MGERIAFSTNTSAKHYSRALDSHTQKNEAGSLSQLYTLIN